MAIKPPRPLPARMSVEEFLTLLDVKPSVEYLDGEVVQKPVTKKPHGKLAGRLIGALERYAENAGGWSGPEIHIDFTSTPRVRYRVPDISFWMPGKPEGDGDIALPPTLAVEIRSPGQTLTFLRDKCRFMQRHGVDVCWLVVPETRTVEVFEAGVARSLREADVLASSALPGFALPLPALFAVLDS